MVRQCSRCFETKPLADFYPDPRLKSGYRSKCKPCFRINLRPTPGPTAIQRALYARRIGQRDCEYVPREIHLDHARRKRERAALDRCFSANARTAAIAVWRDWLS